MIRSLIWAVLLILSIFFGDAAAENSGAYLSESECDALKKKIIKAIEDSRVCESDSDCVQEHFGCPFGCESLISKSEIPRIRQMISDEFNCMPCKYKCPARSVGKPACFMKKCVITYQLATEPQ